MADDSRRRLRSRSASPSTRTAAERGSRSSSRSSSVLAAVPAFAGRAALQDLFFVFTMLALAQYWNLLAGYAGLVSIGQQAFIGLGAYALFAATLIGGLDPLIAILIGGAVAMLSRAADGARRLPPARRLLRHRHLGRGGGLSPDPRAGEAARRRHRHVARARHHQRDGRPEMDRRDLRRAGFRRRATSPTTGWRWRSSSARWRSSSSCSARGAAWRSPRSATRRPPPTASASTAFAPSSSSMC